MIHSLVRVTAVVVAHNGARFLPRTLAALTHQTRPVDGYIAVDAGSTDESLDLLRAHLPAGATVLEKPGRAFGAAVAAAATHLPEQDRAVQDWLWLIHDDSAPEPRALEALLEAVETAPSVTIAGCKQLDRRSPRRLIDAGLSVSRWGERLTMIDVDELDQGQHDARTDSFAVNSAGMLVRRDAWTELGGFDPALPGLGDDVDLCWRNRLAGHRVVVVPGAHMLHAADTVRSVAGPTAARRAEVYLRLKHTTAWKLPFVGAGALLGGVLRFVASLVAKDPGHAVGQLGATLAALLSPVRLLRSRMAAARTRRVSRSVVRPLMVPRREVWAHRRNLMESADAEAVHGDGTGSTGEASNPSGDHHDDFAALATPLRTSAAVGGIAAVLAAAALALVGLRGLLGAPAAAGGSLLPLSPGPGGIWSNATDWWQSLGAGQPGHGDPFDLVLFAASLLGLGNANGAAVGLWIAAMPLAALFAWTALGAVTGSRAVRVLGALAWAVAPPLQVGLASGRPGAVVVHTLLPLAVLGAIRAVGAARSRDDLPVGAPSATGTAAAPPTGATGGTAKPARPGTGGVPSWTAAAGGALALAAVTAGSPALLPLAVLTTVLFAVPLGRRAKALWWMPVPALVLAAPTLVASVDDPRLLFADPGVPQAFDAAPLWQQVLGFPVAFDPAAGAPGLAWLGTMVAAPWALVAALLVGAPLVAAAAVALFRSGAPGRLARAAWLGAALALAGGYAAQLVPATTAGGTLVPAFTGPFVSLFLWGIVLSAVLALDALRGASGRTGQEAGGVRRWARPLVAVACAASVAMAGTLWLVPRTVGTSGADTAVALEDFGAAQQVGPSAERTLPATAADRGNGPLEERTLVVSTGEAGAMEARLMSGAGTTLDELAAPAATRRLHGPLDAPQLREDDDATAAIRGTVAALVSGESIDPRQDLRRLGVSFVVLQDARGGAELLAQRLDAVPGLASVGNTDAGWLWRVVPEQAIPGAPNPTDFTARARVVDANGTTTALVPTSGSRVLGEVLPAGEAGRHLVLAERSDASWSAVLDGQPLPATALGWAQAFELPAEGGRLEVHHGNPWALPLAALQILVLAVVFLLVLPIPQRRRFTPRRVEEYRTTGSAESFRTLDGVAEAEPAQGSDEHAEAVPADRPAAAQDTGPGTSARDPEPGVQAQNAEAEVPAKDERVASMTTAGSPTEQQEEAR